MNWFKKMRTKKELTQKAVAHAVGIKHSGNVSKWEQGLAVPSMDKIPEIAKCFGCSQEETAKQLIKLKKERLGK